MTTPYVRNVRFTPGVRTYRGSCHCGAVRYEVDLDLSQRTTKCNCSVCAKVNSWGTLVKPAAFRLIAGGEALGDYTVTEHGHARFCAKCGIRTFAHGCIPELGGDYVSINLHTLDDAGLQGVRVDYLDGRADTWAQLNSMPYVDPFASA